LIFDHYRGYVWTEPSLQSQVVYELDVDRFPFSNWTSDWR
jgi:hypothetical protein